MKKLLVLVIIVFAITAFLLYRNFVPDDAYIHIAYAKDLLAGKGYSFAGNRTYGSTAPLWPPLIAATTLVFRNLEFSARLLSFIFSIAAITLMCLTARQRFNELESFTAAFLLASNSYFLRWSLTGMESTAAVLFVLLFVFVLIKEDKSFDGSSRTGVRRFLFLILGLAPLIRPEFYLILALFVIYLLLVQRTAFDFLKLFLISGPTVCWLVFAKEYFGTLLPTTYLVKADKPLFSVEAAELWTMARLVVAENCVEIAFAALALILLVTIVKKPRRKEIAKFGSENLVFLAVIITFLGYYSLKDVVVISRYSLMLVPLVILISLDIIRRIAGVRRLSASSTKLLWCTIMLVSVFYSTLFTAVVVRANSEKIYVNFRNEYLRMAGILRKYGSDPKYFSKRPSIALSDVGIIGTYSGCGVNDLCGLVDEKRLSFANKVDYINAEKPDFIILHGEVDPSKIHASLEGIYSATLPPFTMEGTQDMLVTLYRATWR